MFMNHKFDFSTNNISSAKIELLNWMNNMHPDPNDPNNVLFFEALKVITIGNYN